MRRKKESIDSGSAQNQRGSGSSSDTDDKTLMEAFRLLCEHVRFLPSGRRVISAPVATLQARIKGLRESVAEQIVAALCQQGKLAGQAPWEGVEVIEKKIARPAFERERERKGYTKFSGAWNQGSKYVRPVDLPLDEKKKQELRSRLVGQVTVAKPSQSIVTADMLMHLLKGYVSTVTGQAIVRGPCAILAMTYGCTFSDAKDVLARMQGSGWLQAIDMDWRAIVLPDQAAGNGTERMLRRRWIPRRRREEAEA